MQNALTTLERAFELARSGSVATLQELRLILRSEGYSTQQLTGPALAKQLRELMRQQGKPG